MMKKYLTILLFLLSFQCFGDFNRIDFELWCELEPLVTGDFSEFPVPQQEAYNRILEEARIILSYMIYGANVTYTPSDKTRKVQEEFELSLIYEIPWGDKNLTVLDSRIENQKLFAIIRYKLMDFQTKRIGVWKSNQIPVSTGKGAGSLFKGYKNKITAHENAVKEAIREYLRSKIHNKPRKIECKVLLAGAPVSGIKAGEYLSTVRVRIITDKITPYRIF